KGTAANAAPTAPMGSPEPLQSGYRFCRGRCVPRLRRLRAGSSTAHDLPRPTPRDLRRRALLDQVLVQRAVAVYRRRNVAWVRRLAALDPARHVAGREELRHDLAL